MVNTLANHLPTPLDQLKGAALRLRTISPGETLFHQGDSTRGFFYLLEGAIQLQRVTESGQEVLVLRAAEGDTFAEASLFHSTYHCNAVATKSSQVIECSKKAVLSRFRDDSRFALAMSERFAIQVQQMRSRLEILSIRSAEERVFRAVVDGLLSDTITSLAKEIGLTPEVVYRSLASLTQSARIKKVGYGRYSLRDT